jgi:hypothetical protein
MEVINDPNRVKSLMDEILNLQGYREKNLKKYNRDKATIIKEIADGHIFDYLTVIINESNTSAITTDSRPFYKIIQAENKEFIEKNVIKILELVKEHKTEYGYYSTNYCKEHYIVSDSFLSYLIIKLI